MMAAIRCLPSVSLVVVALAAGGCNVPSTASPAATAVASVRVAQSAEPSQSGASIGTATLTSLTDCKFEPAAALTPGEWSLTATSNLPEPHAGTVELFRVEPGHTFDEFAAHIDEEVRRAGAGAPALGPPDWTTHLFGVEVQAGETGSANGSLGTGIHAIICTVVVDTPGDFRPVEIIGPIEIP